MRQTARHSIQVAMLGFILVTFVVSIYAQETMRSGATIGSTGASDEAHNMMDYENAKPLPLPSVPDSVAAQAEKDLIENLMNRNRPSISGPPGQAGGSEGDGVTYPDAVGTPAGAPNKKHLKPR